MGEASVQQAQCELDGGHKGQTRHSGGNAHTGVDAGFPCIRQGDSRLVERLAVAVWDRSRRAW